MKKFFLFIVLFFLVSCVFPGAIYAESTLQTRVLSRSTFEKLGVELNENLANTYYAGDGILIQGHVTDKKEHIIFYLKNLKTGEDVSELYRTNADGSFQIPISFPKTVGKYYIVMASGNFFETTTPEVITLVARNTPSIDPSVVPFSTSVRPTIIYGKSPYLYFGSDIWASMTINQGRKSSTKYGKIITLDALPLKYGNTKVTIQGYPLLTASSLDQIPSRGLRWTGNIFIDRAREMIGKDIVSLRVIRNIGIIQFRLQKGIQVSGEYYLTKPNGDVIKYSFPKEDIDTNGFLRTDTMIRETFLIPNPGVYKIEAIQSNGYAYFNLPVSKTPFWSIIEPLTESQKYILREDRLMIDANILTNINGLRAGLSRKPLSIDRKLSELAQKKAIDMATYSYIGHTAHGGLGLIDFATSQKITITGAIGENVAGGNVSDLHLQDGLEESGSHRYNMIDERWEKIGIGYVLQNGKTYLVQIFGE